MIAAIPLVAKAELAQSYMHQARMMRRWGLGRSRREGWEFSGWVLFMDGDMIQELREGRGRVRAVRELPYGRWGLVTHARGHGMERGISCLWRR